MAKPKDDAKNSRSRWDRVLDKAAEKMFPPDPQGGKADAELRRIADGGR